MNTKENLAQWARSMGYTRKIPQLESICNPSTAFIWEQVMHNIKPKNEVQRYRKNVVINRLQTKPLNQQDRFTYDIKEIKLLVGKQQLENEVECLKKTVSEKESQLDHLIEEIQNKNMHIKNIKQEVKENEERTFLLKCKAELLEKDLSHIEDMLHMGKNLTPIELEDDSSNTEVTERLQKCSEKLERLLKNIPQNTVLNSVRKTAKKYTSEHKENSKYKSGFLSSVKNKPDPSKVARSLYLDDKSCQVLRPRIENCLLVIEEAEDKNDKRESLGILPESCYTEVSDNLLDDDFFLTPTKIPMSRVNEFNCEELAITRSSMASNRQAHYEGILQDQYVLDNVRYLLHNHNRLGVLNCLESFCTRQISEYHSIMLRLDTIVHSSSKELSQEDIAKCQCVQIKAELQRINHKLIASGLQQRVEKAKKQIERYILSNQHLKEKQSDLMAQLELQIEDISLDTLIACLKKEMGASQKPSTSYELQGVHCKIDQIHKELFAKLDVIEEHTEEISKISRSIQSTIDSTLCTVRKLNNFVADIAWATPLLNKLNSKEITVFKEFPVEYIRRLSFTQPKKFYRDICTDSIPSYVDMDSNMLHMIVTLIESPSSPAEMLLMNVLQSKMKLDVLKSLQLKPFDLKYSNYTLEDLKKQESYINYILDQLTALQYGRSANILDANKMKEIIDLWMEMPFKDFISPSKFVDENNFKHYENKYDFFYRAL